MFISNKHSLTWFNELSLMWIGLYFEHLTHIGACLSFWLCFGSVYLIINRYFTPRIWKKSKATAICLHQQNKNSKLKLYNHNQCRHITWSYQTKINGIFFSIFVLKINISLSLDLIEIVKTNARFEKVTCSERSSDICQISIWF